MLKGKRIALLLPLIVGMLSLLPAGTTAQLLHAQSNLGHSLSSTRIGHRADGGHSRSNKAPLSQFRPASMRVSSSGTTMAAHDVAGAPTQQTGAALRVDPSAAKPATINSQFDGVIDATWADQNSYFRSGFHSTTYVNLHMGSGYYERFDWMPTSNTTSFRYQGGLYSNAAAAANAYQDGVSTLVKLGITQQNCVASGSNFQCAGFVYHYTNQGTTFDEEYRVIQENQCLFEIAGTAVDADWSNLFSQIDQIALNIGNAALSLQACQSGPPPPGPTPTSTRPPPPTTIDYQLVSVRIEKNGAGADWNQVRAPLKQVKKGGKVQFSLYVIVNSAPPSEPFTMHWTVTEKGRTIFTDTYNSTLDASQPDQTYRIYVKDVTMKTPGKVQVVGRLIIGNQAKQDSTSFTVLKPHQGGGTPPPPARFSFSFKSLTVTDSHGKAGRTFAVNQQFVIVAKYTIKNVPAGKVVSGQIVRSYQTQTGGGFRKFGGSQDDLTASNGTYTSRHSSAFSNPGTYRILVGITIAGVFHQQHYDITLR